MGEDLTTIPIQGFEEYLTVSEEGVIKRIATKVKGKPYKVLDEPMIPKVSYATGRGVVSVSIECEYCSFSVGRTVYTHFIGKLTNKEVIGYKDGIVTNNSADNLFKYRKGSKEKEEALKNAIKNK